MYAGSKNCYSIQLKIVGVFRKVTLRLLYTPRDFQCELFPTCLPNMVIGYFQQQMHAVRLIIYMVIIGVQYIHTPQSLVISTIFLARWRVETAVVMCKIIS